MIRNSIASLILPVLVACGATHSLAAVPPPLSNPNVGGESPLGPEYFGSMVGRGSVSAGGNAVFSLPIALPPGTAGMEPDLAFSYNSNLPNRLMGYGWFIQGFGSSISRCPQTLSQDGQIRAVNHTSRDRFCLDGQRLTATAGSYGGSGTTYRTEIDSFVRVTSHGSVSGGPSYFSVEYPNGYTRYFGNTSDSKIEAQGKSVVRVWALNRVVDASDNFIDYTYLEINQNGEFRPHEIWYTGNETTGMQPNVRVVINYYGQTPEKTIRFEAGSKITDASARVDDVTVILDGNPVWYYQADYEEFGVNNSVAPTGNHSRLKAITRCEGASDSVGDCQAPVTIDWWAEDNGTPVSQYSLSVPSDSVSTFQENSIPRWHDLNGDGKADYVHSVQTAGAYDWNFLGLYQVMLSDSIGGYSWDYWITYPHIPYHHRVDAISWADMDGDGRTDLVTALENSTQTDLKIAFSTGSSFQVQTWVGYNNYSNIPNVSADHFLYDMNGDKLLDLVVRERNRQTLAAWTDCENQVTQKRKNIYTVKVALNSGANFGPLQTWIGNVQNNADFADMDGDGLVDLISSAQNVHYNNGSGFDSSVTFSPGAAIDCEAGWSYTGYWFYDFNGDSLADRSTSGVIHLNTGASFSVVGPKPFIPSVDHIGDGGRHWAYRNVFYNWLNFHDSYTTVNMGFELSPDGAQFMWGDVLPGSDKLFGFMQAVDIDGDGIYELTAKQHLACVNGLGFNGWCETDEIRYWKSDNPPHHLVKKITSGLGSETEYTFRPIADDSIYTKGTGAVLPVEDVQDSTHVVTTIRQTDGIGGDTVINYTYEGLKRDHGGRGSLGFAKITTENLTTDTTHITEYEQVYPHSSQPKRFEMRRTSDDRLLRSVDTNYAIHGDPLTNFFFSYSASTIETTYSLDSGVALASRTTITDTIDDYGNITASTIELHDLENSSTHKKEAFSLFTNDIANWRVKQLDSTTEKFSLNSSHDASLDRHRAFTYYSATGLLKTSTREAGGGSSVELTTTFGYDQWGNVNSKTLSGPGIQSRSETIEYDIMRGQFPEKSRNAMTHLISRTWDKEFGTMRTQTDVNNQTTTWEYSKFGWLWKEVRPDSTVTEIRRYLDSSNEHPLSAMYTETISSGEPTVRKFYDILGRPIRTRSQGFNGNFILVDTDYDARGRVRRVSDPYFENESVYWNVNYYDHLNRVELFTGADPSKSWSRSYSGWLQVTTDSAFRVSSQRFNALGQVVWSEDKIGTQMQFIHDAVGNRVEVVNDLNGTNQNSVTYTYDQLGRQLTQNDPDHGLYTRTFDALGMIKSEQSPRLAAQNQFTQYEQDVLGRMKTRMEPEGTTNWIYDSDQNGNLGVGKLHSVSQNGFSKTYHYEPTEYGRLTGSTTKIGGSTYDSFVNYNAQGKVDVQTYPSGYSVKSVYNALGFLERVQEGVSTKVLYQLIESDALGRIRQEWLGDGSLETVSYEGSSSRISDQHTVNAGVDIQHFFYTYDNFGNMQIRSDILNSLSETFTYDSLDRIKSATVTGYSEISYDFNSIGNLTKKSDIGNPMLYGSSAIHAVNSINNGIGVDALNYGPNGNLENGDNVPTITWSSYNKPTSLTKGAVVYEFYYDPNRARFKKVHGSNTTHYVGGDYEKVMAGYLWGDHHIIRAYGREIMRRSTFLGASYNQFIHRDHLGSVTAITDDAGSVTERFSYDAWGSRRDAMDWVSVPPATSQNRGYTGHEHLDDIGVIHMNGRVYSPSLGRMLSPDPVTQNPTSGQNYNRYTYAFNNPLKYIDPTGYISKWARVGSGVSSGSGAGRMEHVTVTASRSGGFGRSFRISGSIDTRSSGRGSRTNRRYAAHLRPQTRPNLPEIELPEIEPPEPEPTEFPGDNVTDSGDPVWPVDPILIGDPAVEASQDCNAAISCMAANDDMLQSILKNSGSWAVTEVIDITFDLGSKKLSSVPFVGAAFEIGAQAITGEFDSGSIATTYVGGLIAVPFVVFGSGGVAVGVVGLAAPVILYETFRPLITTGRDVRGARYSIEEFQRMGPR